MTEVRSVAASWMPPTGPGRLRVICCASDGQGIGGIREAFPPPVEVSICGGESMPSALNAAVASLRDGDPSDILCFIHRDARLRFDVEDVLRRYLPLLDRPGILGFCGTKRQTREGHWYTSPPLFGGLVQNDTALVFERPTLGPPGLRYEPVETLDGYCLFMTRAAFDRIGGFDESLDGWHFYDIDVCMRALTAGLVNYVIDQPSWHESWGDSNEDWVRLRGLWLEKWEPTFFATPPLAVHVYGLARAAQPDVDAFMAGACEADGVHLLDLGLDGEAAARLAEMGASVSPGPVDRDRLDLLRNAALELVPAGADVCVCVDVEEALVPGWRAEVERLWTARSTRLDVRVAEGPGADLRRRVCRSPRVHARHGYGWLRPVHEELCAEPGRMESVALVPGVVLSRMPGSATPHGSATGAALREWIAGNPDDARAILHLARGCFEEGLWASCVEESRRFVEHPNATVPLERAMASIWAGESYELLRNQSEARRWLLRAVSEAPTQREPLVSLAGWLARQGDHAGSYSAARAALDLSESVEHELSDPSAWAERPHDLVAVAAYYLGLGEESRQESFAALALNPWDERLIQNAAIVQELTVPEASAPGPPLVDVIVLSNAAGAAEYDMTCRTIASLGRSSPGVAARIVVVETNDAVADEPFASTPLFGNDVTVVLPGRPFGYNAFLRAGYEVLAESSASYLLLLNNDVVLFEDGFLEQLVQALSTFHSVSPLGLREATWSGIDVTVPTIEGFDVNTVLHGWCVMLDKQLFEVADFDSLFPASYTFYGQDVHYGRVLAAHGSKHALVTGARALHLGRSSHHLLDRPASETYDRGAGSPLG